MNVGFIINGLLPRIPRLKEDIRKFFPEATVRVSDHAGHTISLARKFSDEGTKVIIGVGGDGTLHEIVNGIMKSTSTIRPAIGILPKGSANDFAAIHNRSHSISGLREQIEKFDTFPVDVGRIETGDKNHYFINVADAGFGAAVVQRLRNKKFINSSISYLRAITLTFLRHTSEKISVKSADFEWTGTALGVFIANSCRLGSGIYIAPDASVSDGVFEVVIVGDVNTMEYAVNILKLKRGRRVHHPKFHYFRTDNLSIESETGYCIEADGELIGELPVSITVQPQAANYIA